MKSAFVVTCLCLAIAWMVGAQQRGGGGGGEIVLAPKPQKVPAYMAPHKPITRLAELKKAHAGKTNWVEQVVKDELLESQYVSAAPGTKVSKRFHPDTREWWVIQEGQVRFDIEGQKEPIVASKGAIVQVPRQTFYSMEVVSNVPALYFDTNVANARTLYPADSEPPKIAGWDWIPVRAQARRPGVYARGNKPIDTFDAIVKDMKEGKRRGTISVVEDDHGVANFIYGTEKQLGPIAPGDKGHYHPESAEYWFIMAGQIRYAIEGQGVIIADEGDVVYVPKFTFHLPRWYGEAPSCRLAMNGYPDIQHLFEAPKRVE